MIRPEILAPAGNLDKLKIAIDFGADAVYLGGSKLNLRAFADNFTNEKLKEGVEYAHERNRKVYVTMNVFPHNEDLIGVEEYLKELYETGIDAIIASDPAIISTARQVVPDLEIHLSTQANNVNWRAAKFWYDQGVKRVVMARELTLTEIKEMRDNLPEECEIEAFVHGSMCISYSGRCLISNYMVGRDANRGACAQPCRYKYHLVEEKRPGELYEVIEDDKGTYLMNSKDLCMIEHIDDVIKAGVYSLKIEGRMKSLYYVAAVVKSYKQAVDAYMKDPDNYKFDPKWMENLINVSHRQYHTGFYYGQNNEQVYEDSGYMRNADIVGIVRAYDEETKIATIEQKNKVLNGDTVEILRPEGDNFEIVLHDMTEENGTPIEKAARAQMMYKARVDIPLKPKDLLIKIIEERSEEKTLRI